MTFSRAAAAVDVNVDSGAMGGGEAAMLRVLGGSRHSTT